MAKAKAKVGKTESVKGKPEQVSTAPGKGRLKKIPAAPGKAERKNDHTILDKKKLKIDHSVLEKGKPMITIEIIEYIENAVVIKTILKKSSGNISVMSVDTGEGLMERTSPFDNYVQVIDGKVELVISGVEHLLNIGDSIIIPAHSANYVKPDGRFKMIVTVLKSGYE